MARRSRKIKAPETVDEVLAVALAAGVLYLVLRHVAGTSSVTAGYVAVGFGGVLVGASLRPWADRFARRFGVRILREGARPTPQRGTRTSGKAAPKGQKP